MGTRTPGVLELLILNVCGGLDDKIDDDCELRKDRRIDIISVNETNRKGKLVMTSSNAHPSVLIGLALMRAKEASFYQKDYLNVHIAPDMSKPLEEQEKFWADVRDILVKCNRNEKIVILDFGWPFIMKLHPFPMFIRWLNEFKRGRSNMTDDLRKRYPFMALTDISAMRLMIATDNKVTYQQIQASLDT
ncbi:hypothetical protein EVAR_65755_1, partial [Eumeta japonica]